MEQKLPEKGQDNIVRETHVYKTPQGQEGYIEYEYRMVGNKLQYRGNHVGTEARNIPTTWTEIPDQVEIQRQQTGVEDKEVDEVLEIIDPTDTEPDPLKKKKVKIIERKTVQVPVYSDVEVTVKHPYKDRFFK